MKAIILLNGEPYCGAIEKGTAYVLCCDGAYRWAKEKIEIDENLGDFDSVGETPVPPPRTIYSVEKNETDGEIAVERALELGADEIEIYGGGGLREDHFLGNLHLMYRAHTGGARVQMLTNISRILICEGQTKLRGVKNKTLSIIPFGGDAHIMNSKGLHYPLHGLLLAYGSTRGISNIAEEEEISFFAAGRVLVVVNETPL